MTMREEFEESIKAYFASTDFDPCFDRYEDSAGGYKDYYLEYAWIGFAIGRKSRDEQ